MIESLYVVGHDILTPYAQLADFPHGTRCDLPSADLSVLARPLRRGLSDVTRMFMHVANGALNNAAFAADNVHIVFASAFGELSTAEALLQQAREDNSASPARFRHSVHNTSPGLLSISATNTRPSTAIAAGWNTVAMGLLEASTLLACGEERVLLVFAEEKVPLALSQEHPYSPLAAAFVLERRPRPGMLSQGKLQHLRRMGAVTSDAVANPFGAENHPLAPAVFLARALRERTSCTLQVGEGISPWLIDLDATQVTPAESSQ